MITAFQVIMETKSGPIQCMAVQDVTKFYHNDLIVADSTGMMTIFCNQQILCRQSVSDSCINCVQTQTNASKSAFSVVSQHVCYAKVNSDFPHPYD